MSDSHIEGSEKDRNPFHSDVSHELSSALLHDADAHTSIRDQDIGTVQSALEDDGLWTQLENNYSRGDGALQHRRQSSTDPDLHIGGYDIEDYCVLVIPLLQTAMERDNPASFTYFYKLCFELKELGLPCSPGAILTVIKLDQALEQYGRSHSYPDPCIGSDGIERHLNRLIAHLQQLLADHQSYDSEDERILKLTRLSRLADAYQVQYGRSGRLEDLDRALAPLKAIIELADDNDPNKSATYVYLARLQHQKCQKTHSADDLEQGINWARAAVDTTTAHNNIRDANGVLAAMLHESYVRTNNPDHLDTSIELILSGKDDSRWFKSRVKANLASLFFSRFRRTGATNDLMEAKRYITLALNEANKDDPRYTLFLSNLSTIHVFLYKNTNSRDDLDTAIRLAKEASETRIPREDASTIYAKVGYAMKEKFSAWKDPADLDCALLWLQRSVNEVFDFPPADPRRYIPLYTLATGYLSKYDLRESIEGRADASSTAAFEDLDKAIELFKELLESLPAGHAHRPVLLMTTGDAILQRDPAAYEDVLTLCAEVMDNPVAPAYKRIEGAHMATIIHVGQGDWNSAARCILVALNLVPMLSPRSFQRDDQQKVLSNIYGLAASAASIALEAGLSPYEALRRLELGRGIIMSFTIDLRSDITSLQTSHPNLFREFDDLRNEIGKKSVDLESMDEAVFSWETESGDSHTQKMEGHRRNLRWLCEKLEEKIVEIRRLDGYDGFLLPPTIEEMKKLARDGAIVVFNSTSIRSDAFIVEKSGIQQIRLSRLKLEDVEKNIDEMNKIFAGSNILSRHSSDKQHLAQILLWLWDAAVKPVCQALGLEEGTNTKTKRVWWIGVGPLSRAPFHAAGDHSPKSKSNTITLVKSSYITTIKALLYARQDAARTNGERKLRVELVSMPDTPISEGHVYPKLPGVEEEVKCIMKIAEESSLSVKAYDPPIKQHILHHLRQPGDDGILRIVHFACHGISDPSNPLESYILLLENADTTAKLSVREVSTINVNGAYLAFLGACHTADSSVVKLVDEGLHIVSSFQLAGFKNVVGNMWKAGDEECKILSSAFYTYLLKPDRRSKNDDEVANAFHRALKEVRKGNPKDFIGWVPFVHFGA